MEARASDDPSGRVDDADQTSRLERRVDAGDNRVMATGLSEILTRIENVRSVEEESDLAALEEAVRELFERPDAEMGIDTVLNVFERFPTADGYGVFWSIVHGLESVSGRYETKLIASVRRAPSEFSLLMVNRMLNAGRADVEGVSLVSLLKDVAEDQHCLAEVRDQARKLFEYQSSKPAGPTAQ
jgi:hypothetical protein